MLDMAVVAVLVVPVSWVSHGGFVHTRFPVMLDVAMVAVLVVPVSWVSHGGLEQTCCPAMLDAARLAVPVSWGRHEGMESMCCPAILEVAVLVVPVSWVSQGGLEHTNCPVPSSVGTVRLALTTVGVLVVPVSWISQGGFEQTRTTLPFCCPTAEVTNEAPASCLSQTNWTWVGCWRLPRFATTVVVAVLVVPVSWVSQGGLEHTRVTVPGCTSPWPDSAIVTVAVGCSVVGEAKMETGRSCTGWASTPLGVVINVT